MREGQGIPDALRERTGLGRVPALQHGEFMLSESLAIVEYLESVFPPPMYARLLPEEPAQRARARQVMAWLRSDLWALREERPWQLVVYPSTPLAPLSARAAREASELLALVEWLDRQGALVQWTIAQADLALTVLRVARAGHPISAVVEHLIERNLQRPSVRAYLEHPRPPNPPPRPRS